MTLGSPVARNAESKPGPSLKLKLVGSGLSQLYGRQLETWKRARTSVGQVSEILDSQGVAGERFTP